MNTMKKMTSFLKIFSILIVPLTSISMAFGLDITPGKMELTIAPGTEKTISFSIGNTTSELISMNSAVGQYRFLLSENTIFQDNKTPLDVIKSCESWIVAELPQFSVNPGELKEVSFKISVPQNASGEYAASILFDLTTPTKAEEILDNDTQQQIAEQDVIDLDLAILYRRPIAVYIFIEGTTAVAGEIGGIILENMLTPDVLEEIMPNERINLEFGSDVTHNKIKFGIDFINTGTKHTRLKGSIVILEQATGAITANISTGVTLPIFPSFREVIPVYWEPPLKSASYHAIITLDLGENVILQAEKEFSVNEKGFLVQ